MQTNFSCGFLFISFHLIGLLIQCNIEHENVDSWNIYIFVYKSVSHFLILTPLLSSHTLGFESLLYESIGVAFVNLLVTASCICFHLSFVFITFGPTRPFFNIIFYFRCCIWAIFLLELFKWLKDFSAINLNYQTSSTSALIC